MAKKPKRPKGRQQAFRESMGLDIKNKPAELGPLSDAIRNAAKAKREPSPKRQQELAAYSSKLTNDLNILLNYGKDEKPKGKTKSKPMTHKERCAGSVLPMGCFAHPKGWGSQTGQMGGKPAVATYKGGKLKRARYLTGERESLPESVTDKLPHELKWQGGRSNFRVLGQVRNGVFEAIAVAMLGEDTIIANLTDTVVTTAIHNGFTTPALHNRKKPSKKLSPRTVLISTYPDVVRIAWFNRETGKVLKRVKLERI